MLADPSTAQHPHQQYPQYHHPQPEVNPFVLYSRSLHDYTLRLWTESRRIAEEKIKVAAARRQEEERRQRELEMAASASAASQRQP
ncbi:unnamed protein product [Somion occarium]|uniref:Uncharacterized protein n=1 Tax=Somion occarium TaxID=3059160 RepID=A0ABP1CEP1_9APHY